MQAHEILSYLREKDVSFRTVQHGLTYNNLPSAKGWEQIIEHYVDISDNEINKDVSELYLSQIYYGKKNIYFRKLTEVTKENIEKVTSVIHTIYDSSAHESLAVYRDSYPYPVSHDELYSLKLNNPCPVFIEDSEDAIRVIITYPRAYKQRDTFDIDDIDFDGEQPKQLYGYEEIIAIKNGRAQSFDSIYFSKKTGVLQIQIDHSKNILKEEMDIAALRYYGMISNVFNESMSELAPFEKINLFGKISELYNTADGTINALYHSTGTGSVKKERMRRRTDDLRIEKFHQVGLKAIDGDTNSFNITKQWNGDCGTVLKLTIDGGLSSISHNNPSVDCVTIEGCITESDFNLLISKVL
ncbi:hypothetical protein Q4R10_20375 [Morganella morganii]